VASPESGLRAGGVELGAYENQWVRVYRLD
jgi:hypothetical protein